MRSVKVNPRLLMKAHKLSGLGSYSATVNAALDEYVQRRKQLEIFELAGTIDYDPTYHYKSQRRRR